MQKVQSVLNMKSLTKNIGDQINDK